MIFLNWRKLWKIFQHCIQLILLILIPVKISYCWRTLNNTDEKFIRRFESFQNSLDLLAEARERDLSDSFVLSGTSAKFSITFDLAWKVMKDILVQYYAITGFVTGSPREVLKQSFQAKLITGDEWIDMLKIRNQLAHDYDGVIVKEHCQTIIHLYIDKLYDFNIIYSKNSPSSTGGR